VCRNGGRGRLVCQTLCPFRVCGDPEPWRVRGTVPAGLLSDIGRAELELLLG